MRQLTQTQIDAETARVREEFAGLPFTFASNRRTWRAECTVCGDSNARGDHRWVREHAATHNHGHPEWEIG